MHAQNVFNTLKNYPGKRPQTVSKEKKKTMKGRDTTGQS